MNAAVIHAFGAPPRYTNFADPVAGEGDALITITAAGLHPVVRALAAGAHYSSARQLPFIPGVDGVGRLEDGSRVYFGSFHGSFAERAVTARSLCIPLPQALDDVTAAGIANPAMSSWAALTVRAGFKAGESVLVLGATGAAGKLAVQIARRMGARRVIAVGRNPRTLDELTALGADAVIPLHQDRAALVVAYRREWAEAPVDVVLDYLWGQPAEILFEAISQKGLTHAAARIRYIQIGSSAGDTIKLPAAVLRSSGLELLGSGFGSASIDEVLKAVRQFFDDAARNPFQIDLKPVPLRDIEALWTSAAAGRLVFQP